jgi:hypothetical protein
MSEEIESEETEGENCPPPLMRVLTGLAHPHSHLLVLSHLHSSSLACCWSAPDHPCLPGPTCARSCWFSPAHACQCAGKPSFKPLCAFIFVCCCSCAAARSCRSSPAHAHPCAGEYSLVRACICPRPSAHCIRMDPPTCLPVHCTRSCLHCLCIHLHIFIRTALVHTRPCSCLCMCSRSFICMGSHTPAFTLVHMGLNLSVPTSFVRARCCPHLYMPAAIA